MADAYIQLRTNKKGTSGWTLCTSIAKTIQGLGHPATAHRGPIATDPDTMEEASDHVAHILTTDEGKAAWQKWAAEIRAKRG